MTRIRPSLTPRNGAPSPARRTPGATRGPASLGTREARADRGDVQVEPVQGPRERKELQCRDQPARLLAPQEPVAPATPGAAALREIEGDVVVEPHPLRPDRVALAEDRLHLPRAGVAPLDGRLTDRPPP